MSGRGLRIKIAPVLWVLSLVSFSACAEVTSLRVARQYGIGYLQIMVMQHDRLIEKEAKVRGLGDVTVTWSTFADGTVRSRVVDGHLQDG